MSQRSLNRRRAVIALPVAVFSMVLQPWIAQAQRAEYAELVEALESAAAIAEEIGKKKKDLAWYERRGDPYTFGSNWIREVTRLRQELADLNTQLEAREADYRGAVAKFRRALEPDIKLNAEAREVIEYIEKETEGNAVVKQRAINGIRLDLARMNGGSQGNTPASKLAAWYQGAKEALLTGEVTSPVEQRLNDLLKDDPALQAAANRAWSHLTDTLRDNTGKLLPKEVLKQEIQGETVKNRLKALDRWFKYVEWAQRAARLLALAGSPNPPDPTTVPALPQLSEFIDLMGDVADEFKGFPQLLTMYLMAIKSQVDGILAQLKNLKRKFALRNLEAMKVEAVARTSEDGDIWTGLTGGADSLFGVPGPNPKVYPDRTEFAQGETISGRWFGSFRYADSAWMGILPSTVRHNDETVAGDQTIKYVYLNGKDSGRFSFAKKLAPGSYDLRMFDSNDNGREVQSVTIRVVTGTLTVRSGDKAVSAEVPPKREPN